MWMSENKQWSETDIVISDKWRGNVDAHLKCGEIVNDRIRPTAKLLLRLLMKKYNRSTVSKVTRTGKFDRLWYAFVLDHHAAEDEEFAGHLEYAEIAVINCCYLSFYLASR